MDTKTILIGLVIGLFLGVGVGYSVFSPQSTLLENKINTLETQAKSYQIDAEKIPSFQLQLTTSTNEKNTLQTQLTSAQTEISSLQGQSSGWTVEKTNLQTQVSSLENQISSKNIEITNLNQQITTLKNSVSTPPIPQAPTNKSPTSGYTSTPINLLALFTDLSTDDKAVVSWLWSFGDGTSSTLKNPSHSYSSSGTYQVALTVKDSEGLSDTTTRGVTVSAPPPPPPSNGPFVGSKNSNVYHYPSCSSAKQITSANLRTFNSSADARAAGYRPCLNCSPP